MTEEQWEQVLALRSSATIKAMGKEDSRRYLATQGVEGGEAWGGACLLLTTIGRKTGNEIITPLTYLQDGDDVVVVGSFAGLPKEPNWCLNLQKNPRAWVQVKDRRWMVRAHKATPEERSRLWAILTQTFPLWGHFQKYCEREFAVIILSPDQEARR